MFENQNFGKVYKIKFNKHNFVYHVLNFCSNRARFRVARAVFFKSAQNSNFLVPFFFKNVIFRPLKVKISEKIVE